MDTIVINVGGRLFETKPSTLEAYPNTKLHVDTLNSESEYFNKQTNQFFYDRNPDFFNAILDFYRCGELHVPTGDCSYLFQKEMQFWGIGEHHLSDCCLQAYFKCDNDKEALTTLKKAFESPKLECLDEKSRFSRFRSRIWAILEHPKSSRAAGVYGVLSLTFTAFFILLIFLFEMDTFRKFYDPYAVLGNKTTNLIMELIDVNNPKAYRSTFSVPFESILLSEQICQGLLSLEIIIRMIFCPNKIAFFKNALNIIDMILLVTMWTAMGIYLNIIKYLRNAPVLTLFKLCRLAAILRLFRILRFVKQFDALKVLLVALRSSLKELGLLSVLFFIGSLFFGCFIYFAELSEATTFPTMFSGVWWAIVTMTTVGYGDFVPKSTFGYIVACFCATFGILLVAMPIAVVASNFSGYHARNQEREKRRKSKRINHLVRIESIDTTSYEIKKEKDQIHELEK